MHRNAMLLCDFYKLSHRNMYPKGTQMVYSTWTPRGSRLSGVNHVVVFGVQAFIKKWLIEFFNEQFFNRDITEIVAEYKRLITHTLGDPNPETQHIEDLHALGYLPLEIRALPEGEAVPVRVPYFTIHNTDNDKFFWLTNYIESLVSCELWQAATSATIAKKYRQILDRYALETVGDVNFVPFQGHDFSFRGMSSLSSAELSGMGHLLSFVGTDTIPAIQAAEYYYGANIEKELVGTSIPATEHSVQCAYCDDLEYLRCVVSDIHPKGLVSVVSDGYDFWKVITEILPSLKEQIMLREGKVVIRPDSGDPVDIVCGENNLSEFKGEYYHKSDIMENIFSGVRRLRDDEVRPVPECQRKGAIECLWDTFGGTINSKGYKELDPHIGLIYGDSITIERATEICERLKAKGFASTNCVFGIGSFTYQYNTRDTFGFALKSTLIIKDGVEIPIFKDPKTDDGVKKSQRGRVGVIYKNNEYQLVENLGFTEHLIGDQLKPVFKDGKLINETNFSAIRARLANTNI